MNNNNENLNEKLLTTILSLKTESDLYSFFSSFFTKNELTNFFLIWRVLNKTKQNISQRNIAKEEGISLAKVNQIAKILRDDKNFVKILLDEKYDETKL